MSDQPVSKLSTSSTFDRLTLRLREMIQQEHANSCSGAEQFSVVSTNPLTVEQMASSLRLTDGDPDFTVGAWLRQYILAYPLQVGQAVWCLREATTWHLVDLVDPGGQVIWDTGRPGD